MRILGKKEGERKPEKENGNNENGNSEMTMIYIRMKNYNLLIISIEILSAFIKSIISLIIKYTLNEASRKMFSSNNTNANFFYK